MFFKSILKWLAILSIMLGITAIIGGYLLFKHLAADLPDTTALRDVQYQTPLSIYSKNGQLIAQYGEKKRTPVSIEDVPPQLINAFISAEDYRFYAHPGVDYQGLLRAAIQLILTGEKKQGGSTITMQVVRNFLLSREKTYTRKIKEIILALQLEREFTKKEILELYLNKIYLGHRAYGVAAAAQVYYGKKLDELNLAEQAMLAGLPKAPSTTNPITSSEKARHRRNYVLQRMLALNYISQQDYDRASTAPVSAKLNNPPPIKTLAASYIAEMARREIYDLYGKQAYSSGLKVYTTIDERLQKAANVALAQALHEYDQRHGYRKQSPISAQSFDDMGSYQVVGDTLPAYVEKVEAKLVTARLADNSRIEIPWSNIQWARNFKTRNYIGPPLTSAAQILQQGDIIRVRRLTDNTWTLAQVPEVEGAFVALDPNDGAILALTGGFDFQRSKYNRATQSKRQPGSGFKPIIYTTALENGYTAASIINDAPLVIDRNQDTEWRPENYSRKFFGPTRLRTALRKSRNLISIRLTRALGLDKVIATAERFGFRPDQLPRSLSLALGSGYASPLQMARLYAVFANGGFLINPYFIDRIESAGGDILFQAEPAIACPTCPDTFDTPPGFAPRIISPRVNFLMNSLLRDVVQRGTATRAKALGRNDLAGKTGTTNDQRDAWFNGFTADIVASAWVGFDNSDSLGRKETGARAALPMWIAFMGEALKGRPENELIPPEGIVKAIIDPNTGYLAANGSSGIWEYFREEFAPQPLMPATIGGPTEFNEPAPVETLF